MKDCLQKQNKIMLDTLNRIANQPHYSTIDGMMNNWAKQALKEYYSIKREFLRGERK